MERDAFREWAPQESEKLGKLHKTSPLVTKDGELLGGCDDVLAYLKAFEAQSVNNVQLKDDAEPEEHKFDYDLVVIGGGSGGMALSKAAAELLTPNGLDNGVEPRVCCLDYVKPSPPGTKWGFGGTCVNVGCIPKKLYHTAAIMRDHIAHSPQYGAPEALKQPAKVEWERLRENIQMHIKSLNFGSVSELRSANVKYKNALGAMVDPHTIECTNKKGQKETITARRICLAMGGRPNYPDIPGAKEFGITSDDIFSMEKPPGKTVVVGASYIALECAGFLTGLGFDTTVLMRSIPLRGFDQQMAELIVDFMKQEGTNFRRGVTPTKVEKQENGKLVVTLSNNSSIECDTVLFAMGRVPDASINLEAAGVKTAKSGKIVVDKAERTSTPHIYSIGDVNEGNLELTPVAIQQGRLLARRLYDHGTRLMNLADVPTTVFTPLEYGCAGYSEEEAIKAFGESNIEVYHSYFKPLEWTVAKKPENVCYIKMITDLKNNERVIGFHILTPNAGEILQGVGVALKAGATKEMFDDTIGIHPTVAELMTTLTTTKSSGASADQGGC
eukprot:TRINITY_DN525_c0_g1_i1.p1 TRINITY_DN525_c0_g1~~TRINITY_DN525_c0_g1_i1.p1  ORF type:complete len:622 (+),score=330.11 TRINITY_DN525_c0_g1_i1:198-1868(+)